MIIPLLIDAYEDTSERFAKRGILLDLHTPSKPGEKTGVRLDAWSGRGLAQLLLWDTGELELTVGDANNLSSSGSVVGKCDERRRRLRLRLEAPGSLAWESEQIELSPEPTLTHS